MNTNTPYLIERSPQGDGTWWLIARYSDGSNQVFGGELTERGSKRMLTIRAKQFGLRVYGDFARLVTGEQP